MSAPTREDYAARINALMGVTLSDEHRRRRRSVFEAAKTASHCARCGRRLKPSDPVWRKRVSLGRSFAVAPTCKGCADEWEERRWPGEPCEGCGRLVHKEKPRIRERTLWEDFHDIKRHSFCCEVCRHKAVTKAVRERRAESRGTYQCEACGKSFRPTRTDAKFCSAGCKQHAYRKRAPSPPWARRNSRNEGAAS